MNEKILNDIVAYKQSAAIIAAIKLDLFSLIHDRKIIDSGICLEKGWNFDYFLLLVEYLSEIGYLKSHNKKAWSLDFELEMQINQLDGFQNLIEHEKNIFGKWISPQMVIQAIESDYGKRRFDIDGFDENEQVAYELAVYGKSYIFIGYNFLRKLISKKAVTIGELGRTNKIYKEALLKRLPQESHYRYINSLDELLEMYDGIIMTNTIHYYTNENLMKILQHIREHLKDSGVLCITDLFVDNSSNFSKSLYIDWLTHGGVYNLSLDSVLSILGKVGYQKVEQTYMEMIQTYMIFAYK